METIEKGLGLDPHWNLITNLCNPCAVQYKYIAKLETIDTDSKVILGNFTNFNSNYIDKNLGPTTLKSGDGDASKTVKKYFSQVSPDLLAKVRKAYHLDFELFGY